MQRFECGYILPSRRERACEGAKGDVGDFLGRVVDARRSSADSSCMTVEYLCAGQVKTSKPRVGSRVSGNCFGAFARRGRRPLVRSDSETGVGVPYQAVVKEVLLQVCRAGKSKATLNRSSFGAGEGAKAHTLESFVCPSLSSPHFQSPLFPVVLVPKNLYRPHINPHLLGAHA